MSFPFCVFEVANTQPIAQAREKVIEYVRGSRGIITAVIVINFPLSVRVSRRSTIEVHRWLKCDGSHHPGAPSNSAHNATSVAEGLKDMRKGQVWGAYRDGPILDVFVNDSGDSTGASEDIVLLREDLLGPDTNSPRAEIRVSLNHLRAAIVRQTSKTERQASDDTYSWVVDTEIMSDEGEEESQDPDTPEESQHSAYDGPVTSRPTASSERPK